MAERTLPYSKNPYISPFKSQKTGLRSSRRFFMSSHRSTRMLVGAWLFPLLFLKGESLWTTVKRYLCNGYPRRSENDSCWPDQHGKSHPCIHFWIKEKIELHCSSQSLLSRHDYDVEQIKHFKVTTEGRQKSHSGLYPHCFTTLALTSWTISSA